MAQPLTSYVVRHGFSETLMVILGEDDDGYPVEREATDDEAHAHWVEETRAERAVA